MDGSNKKEAAKEKAEKKPFFDYARRSLDICAFCKNKYNVGDRFLVS